MMPESGVEEAFAAICEEAAIEMVPSQN